MALVEMISMSVVMPVSNLRFQNKKEKFLKLTVVDVFLRVVQCNTTGHLKQEMPLSSPSLLQRLRRDLHALAGEVVQH